MVKMVGNSKTSKQGVVEWLARFPDSGPDQEDEVNARIAIEKAKESMANPAIHPQGDLSDLTYTSKGVDVACFIGGRSVHVIRMDNETLARHVVDLQNEGSSDMIKSDHRIWGVVDDENIAALDGEFMYFGCASLPEYAERISKMHNEWLDHGLYAPISRSS